MNPKFYYAFHVLFIRRNSCCSFVKIGQFCKSTSSYKSVSNHPIPQTDYHDECKDSIFFLISAEYNFGKHFEYKNAWRCVSFITEALFRCSFLMLDTR